MAQLWYSPISINSAQVPSTQTNFPVLVSVTDARFKDVAHSGHVNRSDGFDIRPYTDTTLGTAITGYELERYTATTGEVVMWVKVASLSSSTTPIVLGYGDTGITTDGSSSTTWSNSFQQVFHFKDGTTLNTTDSLATQTLTNNNTATAAAGQIDGGVGLVSASSQSLSGAVNLTAAVTYSAWVKGTSFPNAYNTAHILNDSNSNYVGILVKSNGKLALLIGIGGTDKSYDGTGSHTLSTATWYYLTLVYSNAGGLIGYVNAASDGTHAGGTNLNALSTQIYRVGTDPVNAGRFWNGTLDEVRISTVVRAPDWITTEYNNQLAPGTFETLGTEVAVGGAASTSNMFLVM